MQKNDCQHVFSIVHDLHFYLSAADDGKDHWHKIKYVSMSKKKNAPGNVECQVGWYTSVGKVTNFHLQFLYTQGNTQQLKQSISQNSNCFMCNTSLQNETKLILTKDFSTMKRKGYNLSKVVPKKKKRKKKKQFVTHIPSRWFLGIWHQDRLWTNPWNTHNDNIC